MRLATTTLALTVTMVTASLAQSAWTYRIARTYRLGGSGSWDYIAPAPPHPRLFIGRQDRPMVVNENTGTLIGEVTGIIGARGTAIAAASGHGFATSGRDESVVMFDLKRPEYGASAGAVSDYHAGKLPTTVPIGTRVDGSGGHTTWSWTRPTIESGWRRRSWDPLRAGRLGGGPVLPGTFTMMVVERTPTRH